MNKEFKTNESFLHEHAKELLAKFLRDIEKVSDGCRFNQISWRKNYGIFTELPFRILDDPYYFENSAGIIDIQEVMESNDYLKRFDNSFDRGRILFVPDITIFHKGSAMIFIEVVYTNKTPQWKIDRMQLFFEDNYFEIYEVSAWDIMRQVGNLDNITLKKIYP